jgi:hypothetical protein
MTDVVYQLKEQTKSIKKNKNIIMKKFSTLALALVMTTQHYFTSCELKIQQNAKRSSNRVRWRSHFRW